MMDIQRMPLSSLIPASYNPRKISDRALEGLSYSLGRFGYVSLIVWNKRSGNIVGGHQRFKVLSDAGVKEADVVVVDLDDDNEKALNLILNNPKTSGDWSEEIVDLMSHVRQADGDLADKLQFDELSESLEKSFLRGSAEKNVLEEKSTFEPSSLLDGRTKEWKRRKEAWLSCGVDNSSDGGSVKMASAKGIKVGLSTFDPVLCEMLYRWYCPPGGAVFDPFSGTSVRGLVACALRLDYVGVDIRQEQVESNVVRAKSLNCSPMPLWQVGDSAACGPDIEADMVLACPPYFDLETYSDLPEDLSAMDWDGFLESYRKVVANSVALLKNDRFACFVVGDVRDGRGMYRGLVTETVEAFKAAGVSLYSESCFVTAGGSLPMRVRRQFTSARKLGKAHQNVLVFFKGDVKKIDETFSAFPYNGSIKASESGSIFNAGESS